MLERLGLFLVTGKMKVQNFFEELREEERGASDIVAIMVIIIVVILVAAVFKDQLLEATENVFSKLNEFIGSD